MSALLPVLMPFRVFSCHSKLGHFKIIEANGKYGIVSTRFACWEIKKNHLISALQRSIKLIY